jgi:hypothetical protein
MVTPWPSLWPRVSSYNYKAREQAPFFRLRAGFSREHRWKNGTVSIAFTRTGKD